MKSLLVIEEVSIRQDAHGRYSLNDLHKAAMANGRATESHRPSEFLSGQGVQAFVDALDAENVGKAENPASVKSIKGGKSPGTWAAELVAIRYAAWIDPAFEVRVYRAFRQSIADKSTWVGARHQASASFRLMQDMLKLTREDAGKETAGHHYSNEARLVNWAFAGEFTSVERSELSKQDLDLLAHLEEKNALLMGRGVAYDKRKPMLQQYALDWRLNRSLGLPQ